MINSSFQDVDVNPDAAARNLMQKAHNQDGLPEIAIGVCLLATAGLLWAEVVLPPGSFARKVSSLAFAFGLPTLILGSQWAIKRLRRRYLMERVGYVELKPVNRKRSAVILSFAFAVGAAVAFAAWKGAVPPASWFVAGIGIFGGALAGIAGKLPRFYIGGGIMAVAGIVLGLSRFSLDTGQVILYGIMGLLSLVSGFVVLLLFIRKRDEVGE